MLNRGGNNWKSTLTKNYALRHIMRRMHGNQKGLEQNGLNKATVYAAVVNFYG
jgi:hypothetical protein